MAGSCPEGEYFCTRNVKCISEDEECEGARMPDGTYVDIGNTFGLTCQEGTTWCARSMSCIEEGAECTKINMNSDDDDSGWLTACNLKAFTCSRTYTARHQCTKSCEVESECPGQVFCPHTRSCVDDIEECKPKKGLRRPCESKTCSSDVEHAKYACKAMAKECSRLSDKEFQGEEGARSFGKYMKDTVKVKCQEEDHFFCPLTMSCQPKAVPCDVEGKYEESEQIPWGGVCSEGMYFCDKFQVCVPYEVRCSFHTLLDWLNEEENTRYPEGFSDSGVCIPGMIFCPREMRCIPVSEEGKCNDRIKYYEAIFSKSDSFKLGCKDDTTFCFKSQT